MEFFYVGLYPRWRILKKLFYVISANNNAADQGRAPGRASNGGRPFQWFRIWYGWFFFLFEPASEDDGDEASSYEEDRPIEEEQEPLPEGQELTADLPGNRNNDWAAPGTR